jgi:hypothetical protein
MAPVPAAWGADGAVQTAFTPSVPAGYGNAFTPSK